MLSCEESSALPITPHSDSTGECLEDTSSLQRRENATKSIKSRLCEVCSAAFWKYTCPCCETKSCSLPCVKDHKIRLNCSGERNKTEFVDKNEYSDRHLLNDYRFLEEAGRTLYTNKAERQCNKHSEFRITTGPYHYNKRSKLLMSAASKRGVRLKMISIAMKKHRSNTSFYTISTDTIDWHIEWCFAASNCQIHHERVAETEILADVTEKYMNPVNFQHLRKPLEIYRKEGCSNCKFLLKLEGMPANRQRYFQLNPKASVAENLVGHSLTEHPTIFLLPPSNNSKEYPLMDKDDLPFMDVDCLKHLKTKHPAFKEDINLLQSVILDPNSNIYQAEECSKTDH